MSMRTRHGAKSLQPSLFAEERDRLPEGLRYADEVIGEEQERALVAFLATLPLKPFEFVGGFQGNRRVVSFGWRYDFASHRIQGAENIPAELLELREQVGRFAEIAAESFQQVLVTEYSPGAGIGWHKDRPVFGQIVGVSLHTPCRFRLRRKLSASWERAAFVAQPRSAYLLSGPARTQWEHSIPAVDQLRYSITFRTFAKT